MCMCEDAKQSNPGSLFQRVSNERCELACDDIGFEEQTHMVPLTLVWFADKDNLDLPPQTQKAE